MDFIKKSKEIKKELRKGLQAIILVLPNGENMCLPALGVGKVICDAISESLIEIIDDASTSADFVKMNVKVDIQRASKANNN